ncbi:MAG: tyrosine-protein phosphatase [Actinomycetota bacterium]
MALVEHSIVADERRLVPLDGAQNFRDLGGYPLGDGRTIGWGRLFRSDALSDLTDTDVETLDAIGLRTVIDLRSSGEAAEHGSFPVSRLPVAYHHLAIVDATWRPPEVDDSDSASRDPDTSGSEPDTVEYLVEAYHDLLDHGADRFAAAMHTLALPAAMPAVYHCAVGKDRTGLLTALVLGALGVDHDLIADDYALSSAAMDRKRAWVRAHRPDGSDRFERAPSPMLAAPADAMRRLLHDVVAEHGSIAQFVHGLGVGPGALAELADRLAS